MLQEERAKLARYEVSNKRTDPLHRCCTSVLVALDYHPAETHRMIIERLFQAVQGRFRSEVPSVTCRC